MLAVLNLSWQRRRRRRGGGGGGCRVLFCRLVGGPSNRKIESPFIFLLSSNRVYVLLPINSRSTAYL